MEPEIETIDIRAKSIGAQRRGGLHLAPLGIWHEFTLPFGIEAFETFLALATDPKVAAEIKDQDGNWHPMPDAETTREAIATFERGDVFATFAASGGALTEDDDQPSLFAAPQIDPQPDKGAPEEEQGKDKAASEEVRDAAAPGGTTETVQPVTTPAEPLTVTGGPTLTAAQKKAAAKAAASKGA